MILILLVGDDRLWRVKAGERSIEVHRNAEEEAHDQRRWPQRHRIGREEKMDRDPSCECDSEKRSSPSRHSCAEREDTVLHPSIRDHLGERRISGRNASQEAAQSVPPAAGRFATPEKVLRRIRWNEKAGPSGMR